MGGLVTIDFDDDRQYCTRCRREIYFSVTGNWCARFPGAVSGALVCHAGYEAQHTPYEVPTPQTLKDLGRLEAWLSA